jgi:hypothetical protein
MKAKRKKGAVKEYKPCRDLKGCLNDLSVEAFTVGFKMGLFDRLYTRREIGEQIKKGVDMFVHLQGDCSVTGWSRSIEGKPYGPAIPLAGVILAILCHAGNSGWDLGGAIMAQLDWKTKRAMEGRCGG